jgi:hypothetical protein
MREWIDQYYPGTRLAIGEWSWGGEKSISGALAVADVLGIFGREGVDMASYWTFPSTDGAAAQAFQLYTHYNAQGDAFGDQAIAATADTSADYVSVYASVDSVSNDVVIVAINKRFDADVQATIKLNGASAGSANIYSLASGDAAIRPSGAAAITGSLLQVNLPAASLTLARIACG